MSINSRAKSDWRAGGGVGIPLEDRALKGGLNLKKSCVADLTR